MPPAVFIDHAVGDILPAADWSSNWALVEASFDILGPYIQTGLIPTAASGLAVNISSGNALIDANIVKGTSWSITALANSTVNHLYLLRDGTGTSNTTGTAPANSVKLGTATTAGGVVTSVNTLRSSGRQVLVRPENQVPGAVGSMGSINLANWAAAAADNVPVFGVLPAGAVPGTTAPLTLTLDDANQNSVQAPLIIRHSYNAGGGANGIGTALDFSAETATNGVFNTAVRLQGVFADATAATATGRLDVVVLDTNLPSTPMTVASRFITIPQSPAASGQHGLLNIGAGGFAGGAGGFAGDSPGTLLAMNAASGFNGAFFNIQLNGVPKFYLDNFAELFHLGAPVTSANAGHVSLGPDFAHFDGSSAGKFTGSGSGTYLAINAQSGFAGNLIDAQTHGVAAFSVTAAGAVTAAGSLTAGTTSLGITTTSRINNAGQYGGSGAPCQFKRFSLTFPSDADYTLASGELDAYWIDVQTGTITVTRNIIVPVQAQQIYLIQNRNTHAVTIKTATGTGITVAAGRAAWVGSSNGTNMSRLSSDVDFSV